MKGISFTLAMAKAVIDGTKTVTRRPFKAMKACNYQEGECAYLKEPWVAEKCYDHFKPSEIADLPFGAGTMIDYLATPKEGFKTGRFRSTMFLPYALARKRLVIKSVTIENLWDIDEEEAIKEGFVASEGVSARQAFMQTVTEIYGKFWVERNTLVWRIEFEVVGIPQ